MRTRVNRSVRDWFTYYISIYNISNFRQDKTLIAQFVEQDFDGASVQPASALAMRDEDDLAQCSAMIKQSGGRVD